MIHLDLFGKKSSRYEFLKCFLLDQLHHLDLDVSFREHQEIQKFLEFNVLSIPAIRINNKPIMECRENDDIKEFTQVVIKEVLTAESNMTDEILVPIDFSDTSINAIHVAVDLAQKYHSVVRLTHIYHPRADEFLHSGKNEAQWVEELTHRLNNLRNLWQSKFPDVSFHAEVIAGFAAEYIADKSQQSHIHSIVMGTQGRNTILRKWIGSVSLSVCQNASCPVYLIPPDFQRELQRFLFCTADLQQDEYSLKMVEKLAAKNMGDVKRLTIDSTKTSVADAILLHTENHATDVIAVTKRKRSFWSELTQPSTTAELGRKLRDCILLVLHL